MFTVSERDIFVLQGSVTESFVLHEVIFVRSKPLIIRATQVPCIISYQADSSYQYTFSEIKINYLYPEF